MLGLDSIVFDLEGWQVPDVTDVGPVASTVSRVWINGSGDELSLHFFDRPPDLPAPLTDMPAIRDGYRTGVAAQGGGIVSVNPVTIGRLTAVETVFKYPQQPHGMTYAGAITLPFRDFSLVLRVICREIGMTGLRDSMVFAKMLSARSVTVVIEGAPRIADWAKDPYDSTYAEGNLRNRSDDERWDVEFPDHPLSRVRTCLKQRARVAASLQIWKPRRSLRGREQGRGGAG